MSNLLFRRNVEVRIETDQVTEIIKDLKIDFKIKKNRGNAPNSGNVHITNMNESTVARINKTGSNIYIYAGYEDNLKLLGQMITTKISSDYNAPNKVIKIQAQDGILSLLQTTVNLSFKSTGTVKQAIKKIASKLGIDIVVAEGVNLDVQLGSSYSYSGYAKKAIGYLTEKAGVTWSMQNGDLTIYNQDNLLPQEIPLVSKDTGMIGSPQQQTNINTFNQDAASPFIGWKIKTLLRSDINPGHVIRIRSNVMSGDYEVDSITHEGGNYVNKFESNISTYSSSEVG